MCEVIRYLTHAFTQPEMENFVMKHFSLCRRSVLFMLAACVVSFTHFGCGGQTKKEVVPDRTAPRVEPLVEQPKQDPVLKFEPAKQEAESEEKEETRRLDPKNLHFRHSVAQWTVQVPGSLQLKDEETDKLCEMAKRQGMTYVSLGSPKTWETVSKSGLKVGAALPPADPAPFAASLADPKAKEALRASITGTIVEASDKRYDVPFIFVFTGMKVEGVSKEEAKHRLIDEFTPLARYAFEKGSMLVLEMLNTSDERAGMISHPGYYGDSTDYCAEIVQKVNARLNEEFGNGTGVVYMGLVFDFYHQAKMGEDSIALLNKYSHLVHYIQTANAPDRTELHLDGSPDYPKLMREVRRLQREGKIRKDLIVEVEWIASKPEDTEVNFGISVRLCEPSQHRTRRIESN